MQRMIHATANVVVMEKLLDKLQDKLLDKNIPKFQFLWKKELPFVE